jgi:hypothetical protein
MANVGVSITYTSPTWNANPNSGTFPNDSGVTFTNNDPTNDCKLWYQVPGGSVVLHTTIAHNGGSFSLSSGVSFTITATSITTPPAMSHVIHVGSGVPAEHRPKY